MSKKLTCSVCNAGPFKGTAGLNMHTVRKHSGKGADWGSGEATARRDSKRKQKSTTRQFRGGFKEAVINILKDHPNGLKSTKIVQQMQTAGFRPNVKPRNLANYVATLSSKDPDIIRMERGHYRLRPGAEIVANDSQEATTVKQTLDRTARTATATTTAIAPKFSQETIELRLAQVTLLKDGLADSLINLIRSIRDV